MPLHQRRSKASRAASQVCHTGQGQDERAPTPPHTSCTALTRRGFEEINPHRESGTRSRAAADVGAVALPGRGFCSGRRRDGSGTAWATPLELEKGWQMRQVAPFSSIKRPPFSAITFFSRGSTELLFEWKLVPFSGSSLN
jgi:hypothetical protein